MPDGSMGGRPLSEQSTETGTEFATKDARNLLKKRFVLVIVAATLLLIVGHQITPASGDWWKWAIPLATTVGTTLITAAALGFILADKDYSKLLRELVVDVIFSPENYRSNSALTEKWRTITLRLLGDVLPFSKEDAVNEIQAQFLTHKKDLHFEEVEFKLDIKVDEATNVATIIQKVNCRLVVSPNCQAPEIVQYITVLDGGSSEMTAFEINGIPVQAALEDQPTVDNPHRKVLRYAIPEESILSNGAQERYVSYKRTYDLKQNLDIEPFVATNIERYIKGCRVEARVSGGYRLYFKRFGLKGGSSPTPLDVAEGYKRWVLAEQGELLLPGESYNIMFLKEKNP